MDTLLPPPSIQRALQSGLVLVVLFAASRQCVSQIDAIEPALSIELQRFALRLMLHFCLWIDFDICMPLSR